MAYFWKEEWATGNSAIDAQHKQLVKALNELVDACSGGQGRTKLNSTMQFLIDYTVKHFEDEEKLQQQHQYPGYPSHKKLHEDFKLVVLGLAKQLREEGPSIVLLAKVNSSMGDWLISHIQNEDKKIAAFISSQYH